MTTTDLSYPIGRFNPGVQDRKRILLDISETPGRRRDAVEGLTESQLDTPYRPGGWTVRQVVHHLADSHMHSYIRTKFALTQNEPTIMAYDENIWAGLIDARTGPLESSLVLLEGLHARWVQLLQSLNEADWKRKFNHPERGAVSLDINAAIYAWHGRHHTAHITELRKREGWGL